jgi:hypothetical protein
MSYVFSQFVEGDPVPAARLSEALLVSKSTIYRWAQRGTLKTTREGGRLVARWAGNEEFVKSHLTQLYNRPQVPFVPKEIKRFGKWLELLDEVTWLLKICYSAPKEIKAKRFRLDQLFANFLKCHRINLRSLRGALDSKIHANESQIRDDLKRGWYNELAYSLPLKASGLGLSFQDVAANKQSASVRFAFPSWKIASAYYSAYFYLRSITIQKQSNLRLQEHGATINAFKNNLLRPLARTIWKFPFNIQYCPDGRMPSTVPLLEQFPHVKYHYCNHPRPPHRTASNIRGHVYRAFARRGRKKRNAPHYTLFDYLHDFRVWANYLEIDNLLSLSGEGYKSFLDQTLSVLLFFIAGMAELCFMASAGEEEYGKSLQSFYDLVVVNDALAEADAAHIPHYQRLEVYRALGLTQFDIRRLKPDPNIARIKT